MGERFEGDIEINKREKSEYGCIVMVDGKPLVISGEPGEEALLKREDLMQSEEQYDLFLRMVRCWALMEKRRHSRALFSDLEVFEHPELGSVSLTCLPVDGKIETARMWLVLDTKILADFLSLTRQAGDVCHGLAGIGRDDQLIVTDKWNSTQIGVRLDLSKFFDLFHKQVGAIEDMLAQQEEKRK